MDARSLQIERVSPITASENESKTKQKAYLLIHTQRKRERESASTREKEKYRKKGEREREKAHIGVMKKQNCKEKHTERIYKHSHIRQIKQVK